MITKLLFSAALVCANALAAQSPNVLFILVDDLGYSDVACYGNTLHETPNVDRLAREGTRFTDAYAACAVCSPTRASIQTGQYPIRYGLTDWIAGARRHNTPLKEIFTQCMLPLEEVTVAEAFNEHGYQTAFVGKWHLNDKGHKTGFPEDQGYQVNIGGHHRGTPPGGYWAPFNNPKMNNQPDDKYLTDRMGDETIQLLEGYSKERGKPFFLMLSFYTVHTPIQPKPELKAHYAKKLSKDGGSHGGSHWKNPEYAAMVHSMDENIGRILKALDKLKLSKDTIVVFVSDNGGLRPQTSCFPLSKGKGYYHEGGIRIPLIIRQPEQVAAGVESDEPVISNDLFPTLLDLAGLPLRPDQHKDGLSLKPVLQRKAFKGHDALYWHYPHYHAAGETPTSAIRVGDYKLIRHYQDGELELYDLNQDIGEKKNLIQQKPEKAKQLEATLDKWLSEMDAYIPVQDPDFDPSLPTATKRRSSKRN